MPVTDTRPSLRWASGRALGLHLALLLVLPLCGIAAWWQVQRALSGNLLSWMYVLEWPAFGGIAVWLWWVLLTTRSPAADEGQPLLRGGGGAPLRWQAADESAPLRDYNAYLAELNAGRKAARPRRSRSLI